jgi:hypothetical protein
LEFLAFAYYLKGNMSLAMKFTKDVLELNPEHVAALGNMKKYENVPMNQSIENGNQKGCYFIYFNLGNVR